MFRMIDRCQFAVFLGVKTEAKEQVAAKIEADAQLENEFWPSTDKPDNNNQPSGPDNDVDMRPKLEEPVKSEADLVKKPQNTSAQAPSAVKRKKEEEGLQSPNPKRPAPSTTTQTTSSTTTTPSKPTDKPKTPNKPAITIVTSAFKPKPSPKPAPDTPKNLTEQEEKEAKAKRMADKKQELSRLRQQLASTPKSGEGATAGMGSPKPAIPKPDFDEVASATSVKKMEGETSVPEPASTMNNDHIARQTRVGAATPGNTANTAKNSKNIPAANALNSPALGSPGKPVTANQAGVPVKTKEEKSAQLVQLKQRLAELQQRKAAEGTGGATAAKAETTAKSELPASSFGGGTQTTNQKQPSMNPSPKMTPKKTEPEVIEIE